jgi:hypothetical protein
VLIDRVALVGRKHEGSCDRRRIERALRQRIVEGIEDTGDLTAAVSEGECKIWDRLKEHKNMPIAEIHLSINYEYYTHRDLLN